MKYLLGFIAILVMSTRANQQLQIEAVNTATADQGLQIEAASTATAAEIHETQESWDEYLNKKWSKIKKSTVWSQIAEAPESVWSASKTEIDEVWNLIKENDTETIKAACATAGGITGAFAPAAFYSTLGLSSTGPLAGGIFAGAHSAGMVSAGSVLAGIQSAAMTGPLIPVILGTGAIGAAAYFICSSFQDYAKPNRDRSYYP